MGPPPGKSTVLPEVRTLLLLVLVLCSGLGAAFAQTARFGVRAGLAVASTPTDIERFEYLARNYELSVADVKVGYHAGVVLQFRLGKIAIQPEVLVLSSRTDYRLDELFNGRIVETIASERYTHVAAPVLVAYRWGPVRLQAGPVVRMRLSAASDFVGIADYIEDPEVYTYGYQAGIGFDIRRVLLDIKYDGAFDRSGNSVMLAGRDIAFGNGAGRTFLTLGFLFN